MHCGKREFLVKREPCGALGELESPGTVGTKRCLMHCRLAPVHGEKIAWVHSGIRTWVEAGRAGMGHPGNGVGKRRPSPGDYPSSSQGQQLSTESLQQLLERALTPLVDEVKQRGLAPACPSCQRLHKKILVPGIISHHAPLFCQGRGRGAPGTRYSWCVAGWEGQNAGL